MSYKYTVSANNNNATYSVVLKPYLNGGNHCIQTKETLAAPVGGVNMAAAGDIIVNNATNGTNHINCTLQIKDTTNLYTGGPYSAADGTAIAGGVVTTQDEDGGAAAEGIATVLAKITEGRVNDLLARIVANWEGIITGGLGGSAATATNCPIKNIFLRITV